MSYYFGSLWWSAQLTVLQALQLKISVSNSRTRSLQTSSIYVASLPCFFWAFCHDDDDLPVSANTVCLSPQCFCGEAEVLHSRSVDSWDLVLILLGINFVINKELLLASNKSQCLLINWRLVKYPSFLLNYCPNYFNIFYKLLSVSVGAHPL